MSRREAPVIFTCGYQGRSLSELLAQVSGAGVDVVVDVRDRAASRRPDFNKARLSVCVEEAELRYMHLPQLGVPAAIRKGPGGSAEAVAWYSDRLTTDPPEELDALADLAVRQTVLLLCYEASASDCHRHVLAEALVRLVKGEVTHL